MDIPTPANIKAKLEEKKAAKVEAQPKKAAEKPKKPFVRKEHLTDRPLKEHPGLKAIAEALHKDQPKKSVKNGRKTGGHRSGKTLAQSKRAHPANGKNRRSK